MEFHNKCHNKGDGKFCKGTDGAGRIREIKDPEKREAAEKEQKSFIKRQKEARAGNKATRAAAQQADSARAGHSSKKAKTTKEFDDKETELEKVRNSAYDKFAKSSTIRTYNEYAKAENELAQHRNKTYSTDDHDRIRRAEGAANSLRVNKDSPYANSFQKSIFEKSGAYWSDEVVRAKAEARGQKTETLKQKLGPTVDKKTGTWPKADAQPPRKVETIADAGRFGKTEIDGLKVKKAYEVTTADGQKMRVYDLKGSKAKDVDSLIKQSAAMQELYPQTPPRKLVLMNNRQTIRFAGARFGGFVFPGDDNVFINMDEIKHFKSASEKGWTMPAGKDHDPGQYVYTHEFGHQFDANNKRSGGRGMYENPEIKKQLSDYGKSIPEEGYAEAFAEWHVTEGKTTNPAAIAYAKHEGWHGSDRIVETAAGAKRYGVSIGQPIPEGEPLSVWDPWTLAENLGIITFAVEEDDVDNDGLGTMPKAKKPEEEIPFIKETWDPTKEKNLKSYATLGPATESEKEEADKVVKEVWKMLGLKYQG
jgi:hypothetical protein